MNFSREWLKTRGQPREGFNDFSCLKSASPKQEKTGNFQAPCSHLKCFHDHQGNCMYRGKSWGVSAWMNFCPMITSIDNVCPLCGCESWWVNRAGDQLCRQCGFWGGKA